MMRRDLEALLGRPIKKSARRPLRPLHQFERDLDRSLRKRAEKVPDVRESVIEKKIVSHAKLTGWLVRKLSWVGRNGAPDRIFMRAGVVLFLEIKQRGKRPTLIQEREHKRMREAGMEVYVVDSVEKGIAILDRYA